MKRLITLAVLAFAAAAHAEVIATLPNKAGGEIKLTSDACKGDPDRRFFYATSKTGDALTGCWTMVDTDVVLHFDNGTRRVYDMGNFKLREDKPRARNNSL